MDGWIGWMEGFDGLQPVQPHMLIKKKSLHHCNEHKFFELCVSMHQMQLDSTCMLCSKHMNSVQIKIPQKLLCVPMQLITLCHKLLLLFCGTQTVGKCSWTLKKVPQTLKKKDWKHFFQMTISSYVCPLSMLVVLKFCVPRLDRQQNIWMDEFWTSYHHDVMQGQMDEDHKSKM